MNDTSASTLEAVNALSFKINPRQRQMIEVLSDPANKDLNVTQKCEKAGVSTKTYYDWLRRPDFLRALRFNNLGLVLTDSPSVIKRVLADAKGGHYKQQKMALEMSGDYSPSLPPTVNLVFNAAERRDPQEVIDISLADKLAGIKPTAPKPI